jgi:uncharacterized protein
MRTFTERSTLPCEANSRMKRITLPALAALAAPLALLAAGCASSPPSRFYRLTAVAPSASARSAGAASAPVVVAAVHIPFSLDRQEIVRTGPGNALEISGLERWGAPLDQMIQGVLTQDLIERLPSGEVVLPSGPAPAGTDRIVVDVLAFQCDTDGHVSLEGSWSLVAPGASAPSLIRTIRDEQTASATDFNRQAAVMSEMLGRLADDIARTLPHR